jgi:hypothetical protein
MFYYKNIKTDILLINRIKKYYEEYSHNIFNLFKKMIIDKGVKYILTDINNNFIENKYSFYDKYLKYKNKYLKYKNK